MPNVKSAAKRARQDKKRNLRNRGQRSALRTAIRHANETIEQGDADAISAVSRQAASIIGRTASKGVIHRRKAARLQSRLRRRSNRALAQDQVQE